MKVRGVGHQLILVPITSETEFALIPNDDRDSERKLNKDWEGTFTDVSQILQLPILPQVSVKAFHCMFTDYSQTSSVSTLKDTPNLHFPSEVLTISTG